MARKDDVEFALGPHYKVLTIGSSVIRISRGSKPLADFDIGDDDEDLLRIVKVYDTSSGLRTLQDVLRSQMLLSHKDKPVTLAEYYAQQDRMREAAIERGTLVLSESDAEARPVRRGTLSLSSDKAEIAAIKSIASGLTKTVTDSLKAIAKGKDAASIKSAVEEADASIAKQLKRLKSYASNLEGDDEDLDAEDADIEGEDRAPAPKLRSKQSVKPTGKSAKAVAASHGRRTLRLAADDDLDMALGEMDAWMSEVTSAWTALQSKAANAKDWEQLKAVGSEIAKLGAQMTREVKKIM